MSPGCLDDKLIISYLLNSWLIPAYLLLAQIREVLGQSAVAIQFQTLIFQPMVNQKVYKRVLLCDYNLAGVLQAGRLEWLKTSIDCLTVLFRDPPGTYRLAANDGDGQIGE